MTIWTPDLNTYPGPRYRALATAIADAIETEALVAGDKLPTHRALAERLGVTVGTVTRGYAEAERRGLISGRVGSGTYVRGAADAPVGFGIGPEREGDGRVNFGLSFPVPGPRQRMLADALRGVADDPAALADALSYQPEAGLPRHRARLAAWWRRWGVALDAEETLLTLGGLHGVYLALQCLCRPGGTVLSAGLTYPGLIAAARALGLRHAGLAMDDGGVRPDALAAACERDAPRALYLIPNQNNPTTACLDEARRRELLAIARRYGVTVIEDEVHLVSGDERPPNLVALDPDNVIYVSGCSKLLAGGLRVGLLRAPAALVPRLADGLRSHCWMAPPLNAEVACRWIDSGDADWLADWQRREVGARQQLAAEVLAGHTFQSRPYGFNLWLQLPEPWRAAAFVGAAERAGVVIRGGEPFAVGAYPVPQSVRLCLSAPGSQAEVRSGLEILCRLLGEGPAAPRTL